MNVENNSFSDQQQKNMKEKVNSRGQQFRDCSIEKRLGTKTEKTIISSTAHSAQHTVFITICY